MNRAARKEAAARSLKRRNKKNVVRKHIGPTEHVWRFFKYMPRYILSRSPGRDIMAFLINCYIRFIYYSSRVTREIHPDSAPYMRGEKPAIFAFWHARLGLMPCFCPPKRKMQVMISIHRDGAWIAAAMHQFGFGTIRGSSNEGGFFVVREGVKAIRRGDNLAITPDGPRGPAEIAQPGALAIAAIAGVPVIPVGISIARCKRARSWDRFMIPLPFSRYALIIEPPIHVDTPQQQVIDRISPFLTDALVRATGRADALVAEHLAKAA